MHNTDLTFTYQSYQWS